MSNPPQDSARAAEPASMMATVVTFLAVALAVWILLGTIKITRAGWVPAPMADDWDRWDTYVTDHYTFSWFFREHVDHRLVVPKVLFAIDHLEFHARGWFVILCSFCFQAATGSMLWWLSGRAYRQDWSERWILAAAIAACVFSGQQWINFVWPFQVQFPMVYCASAAVLLAIWESARQNWRPSWMAASIVLATVATYSMANGILMWPVMLLAGVWLRMPRKWIGGIAAGALLVGVSYFYHWRPSDQPGAKLSLAARLPRALIFWLGHLGSPMYPLAMVSNNPTLQIAAAVIPGALLALALLAGFVMLWRRREYYRSAAAVLIFYAVFLAGTSATMAYGRSNGSIEDFYSSRYLTPSYLFWATMLLAAWPLLRRAPRTALYGAVCAAMLLGVVIHQRVVLNINRDREYMERLGEIAIVDSVTDPDAWQWVYHTPSITGDAINYLRENSLTVFTEEWTHWPGIPLARRFSIDHNPDACQGQFDPSFPIPSPLKPGWRLTGWAWDNKAGRSPRYIVFGDDSGLVAGVALTGFPPPPPLAALSPRYVASTWNGYVRGQPRPITAYVVEADERSLCAIGTRRLQVSGSEVAFNELGASFPVSAPQITGAFVPNGYFMGLGSPGVPPVDGPVFGSFPDAATGSIRLGPFHVDGHTEMAIPVVTGPDNHNLSMVVRDAASKEILAQMDPLPIRVAWWAWHPQLPPGREMTVEVYAEDKGSGWGQWLALGWPHVLQQQQ